MEDGATDTSDYPILIPHVVTEPHGNKPHEPHGNKPHVKTPEVTTYSKTPSDSSDGIFVGASWMMAGLSLSLALLTLQ